MHISAEWVTVIFNADFFLQIKKNTNLYGNKNHLALALVSGLSAVNSQESLPSSRSQLELLSFQNKSTKVKPLLECISLPLLFLKKKKDLVPTLVY